ncbi:MAG TPA: UbiD family decarboxylase, partial [Chloroflexota bacterium]|nr:UbiD family decarboxylase [Chloroflexota bacterium]
MAQLMDRPPAGADRASIGEDLRDWLDIADRLGDLERIDGADPDLEIGGLTEIVALHSKRPHALLFDNIKGFPAGYRVASNSFITRDLASTLLGIPRGLRNVDMTKAWREKAKDLKMLPAREVADGPVMENVLRGQDVDLLRFPTPRWHESDTGRFIGTACAVITQDPDDGRINVGCYRMMLQDRDKVGLYISPGKHGRVHRDKYFAAGKAMPVAAVFGMHPLIHLAGSISLPLELNEYDWVGAIRGQPVEVIRGPVTGLPIPASAEIVVEGFVDPEHRMDEGPFGEWTGYYASAVRQEPYIQIEGLYHRNDPILLGSPPMRPPGDNYHAKRTMLHALIWDALEGAGITDVKEV